MTELDCFADEQPICPFITLTMVYLGAFNAVPFDPSSASVSQTFFTFLSCFPGSHGEEVVTHLLGSDSKIFTRRKNVAGNDSCL